ncbi:alpha/beta fold hydrolase [Saccharopolyspora taberi]|uniref:Alpha/beta fold hydrolase n=1 Tax=Saccharopolyspora taberi TaxID=60895 RepID=A0ABN3VIH9_9PSEU
MFASLVIALLTTFLPAGELDHLVRSDWDIPGGAGTLQVREVRLESAKRARPVVLLHGARVPGVASFDLPVQGGSLAEDLARDGHRVFVLDATGYGGSTRPPAMTGPPEANPPLVTGEQVVKDIDAVVRWLRAGQVDLVGWATGGHWAAWYASEHPHRVANLVVHSSLYGATAGHPMFDAPPPTEAYRLSTAAQLLPAWDSSIPVPDKTEWRDPRVAQSYVDEALASDPTSEDRDPPSFRAPTGAMVDSHQLANGTQLWDAQRIRARTLVLRGEYDFWSRPADLTTLAADLTAAKEVRAVTLAGATHYVHLDRPEKGRAEFLQEVTDWLR